MSAELTVSDFVRWRPKRNIFTAKGAAFLARPQPAIIYKADDLPNPVLNTGEWGFIYSVPIGPEIGHGTHALSWVKAKRILMEVAAKYQVTEEDIRGEYRFEQFVLARHELAYRIKTEVEWNLCRIARFMGNRDHTGVSHGIRRHEERLREEAEAPKAKKAPNRSKESRARCKDSRRERYHSDPVYRAHCMEIDRAYKARKRAERVALKGPRPKAKISPELAAFRESVWGGQ